MAATQFDALLESVQRPGATFISPERLAGVLGLQVQDIAEYAGVHRNTVRLHPENPRLQGFARNTMRVLRMAEDLNGDPEKAVFLFKNAPIPSLQYRTALELVAAGRFDDLAGYLESVSSGFVG